MRVGPLSQPAPGDLERSIHSSKQVGHDTIMLAAFDEPGPSYGIDLASGEVIPAMPVSVE